MGKERVIGIDLGTTNSCAAVVEGLEQKVKLIPYRGGEYTIPSIYAIDDKGNELVGHEAKRQWQLNPKKTVYGSKRLLGRQYDQNVVDKMHEYFAYDIKESGDKSEVTIPLAGRVTLQESPARSCRRSATSPPNTAGPGDPSCGTVPAYFNDRQRQAVREAGRRSASRPHHQRAYRGRLWPRRGPKIQKETVAIHDSAVHLDISVVEIRDRVFEVKATGGDIFLGGVDFDNRVVDWVIQDFAKKHPDVDLRTDPIALQRIRDLAERSKIDLSTRKEVAFSVPFVTLSPAGVPVDIDTKLQREVFEKLTQDLIDRTIDTCRRVCEDAQLKPTEIEHVLLVGGMTRMPRVQEAVTNFFQKQPSKQVNPDEAVAIGAAMFAYSLEDDTNLKVQVLDVIPMAIGIEDSTGRLHEIFKRNDAVPNLRTLTFTTSVDDQENLECASTKVMSGRRRTSSSVSSTSRASASVPRAVSAWRSPFS
jgi:molecular chaperone DnaK